MRQALPLSPGPLRLANGNTSYVSRPVVVVVEARTAVAPGQALLCVIALPLLLRLRLEVEHQHGHSQRSGGSMFHPRAHCTVHPITLSKAAKRTVRGNEKHCPWCVATIKA